MRRIRMRVAVIALLLAPAVAHAGPADDWLAAVRRGDIDAVAKLTRLPLAVASRGVCLPGGSFDHPRLTGVAGRRGLRRTVAALRACIDPRARVQTADDGSRAEIAWGQESIWQIELIIADGKVTAIEDFYSYGGP